MEPVFPPSNFGTNHDSSANRSASADHPLTTYSAESEADIMHHWADECAEEGYAYFFAADRGSIKIGFTTNLVQRTYAIRHQTGVPGKMLAFRLGGRWRERAYHSQFQHLRRDGEWFARHPDILSEIERLNG